MLTEICEFLKNWFDTGLPTRFSKFTIKDGKVEGIEDMLSNGQYYRIRGSVFNDGVYKYSTDADANLTDEVFDGSVCAMAVPKRMVSLAKEIAEWQAKYGEVNSEAMSPFQSESFAGYSYSKKSGGESEPGGAGSWQDAFKSRLNRWRKI